MNRVGKIAAKYSTLLILLGLIILFSLLSPRFLRFGNLLNIVDQSSMLAIVAIGVTFTIISGGIDLSVGSLVALTGAISAGMIVNMGVPAPIAMLGAILLGVLIGLVNGGFIVFGRLQPFVATLAMMAIARGLTLFYTQGSPISGLGDFYTAFGGTIGPIPVTALVLLFVLLLSTVILQSTPFGAHLYALGGNEETARLAGVKIRLVKLGAYAFSGGTAALGGILLTARLWSAQPQAAVGLELQAIAATVLGGASLMGGAGTSLGTVAGALIMGVLANGLNLTGVSSYVQQVITGTIFILAVILDMWTKRQRREKLQG
ncbi:ABC transporter permease [Salinispira pacifica]|uniref:Ribose ABC transport system, permease protein RbsC n=1 Tax=Salinispira pacifica TaxID=1307761 RepID=V5WGZ5_9SPIO|nr:ABC transporter permease [Salinispira pacifica]AHC14905.1 Ribose ABC transport system, permease protein RbsC [Salinispira pacifica]